MRVLPILTEKSLREAKKGHYTFWVTPGTRKDEIKKYIEKVFEVKVGKVRTMNARGERKRNWRGRIELVKARKKAVVALKEGKIDLFEEKTKEK
ncbi:MAG: 50S ribosomal protein L23 [Patescibacteria group bacterium]